MGTLVFLKDLGQKKPGAKGKFMRPYLGLYKVLEIKGDNMVALQLPFGPNQVHVNISWATPDMIHAKLRYDDHRRFRRCLQMTQVYWCTDILIN